LVILIKPTVIDSDRAWASEIRDSQDRIRQMSGGTEAR
jgi:hypothetical protein